MSFSRSISAATLLLVLAGCVSVPSAQHRSQRQAAYAAAAGAPVSNFRFFTTLYSWEPLSEDQLVVYTRPREAWLLDLAGCQNLLYTNSIALTSSLDQVSVNFDKVLTQNANFPCTISRIRPVHLDGLKMAIEKRVIRSEPRTPASNAPAH